MDCSGVANCGARVKLGLVGGILFLAYKTNACSY